MADHDPRGTDWTDREIDLIVADYFNMLQLELAGRPYVKSRRNAALQELTGRSHGSIERKHQNISAALVRLGRPWIRGYKPLTNIQHALIAGIERHLDARLDSFIDIDAVAGGVAEARLFIEPAPELIPIDEKDSLPLRRLIRKFDPAERDARNRDLGRRGEEVVLRTEHARLRDAGRDDLARQVRWVSEEDGDGAGFDVLSFDVSGGERLLEVKTTTGHQTTPFFLTENERAMSVERSDAFRLVRLYDFARAPRAFELVPPLEDSVVLRPTNYRASFG
ncbi:MAG: DUF3883 domain-containing protein [Alphaproteobacteria bacterium]